MVTVVIRLPRYASTFNDLDSPEDQPLREVRATALEAWRNHLVAEEQQHAQRTVGAADLSDSSHTSSRAKTDQPHRRRASSAGSVEALFLSRGPSAVSLMWEPGVEGVKRENTDPSVKSRCVMDYLRLVPLL